MLIKSGGGTGPMKPGNLSYKVRDCTDGDKVPIPER